MFYWTGIGTRGDNEGELPESDVNRMFFAVDSIREIRPDWGFRSGNAKGSDIIFEKLFLSSGGLEENTQIFLAKHKISCPHGSVPHFYNEMN